MRAPVDRREARAAFEAAMDAIAAGDDDAALREAVRALRLGGIDALLKRRAAQQAAEAIGAETGDINLDDAWSLLDRYGRNAARAAAISTATDLPVGAFGTLAGARVVTHLRDQLAGRRGFLSVRDGKSGARAVPRLPSWVVEDVARLAGRYMHQQRDMGGDEPLDDGSGMGKMLGRPTMRKSLRAALASVLARADGGRFMQHANFATLETIRRKIADARTPPNPVRDAYMRARDGD